jgi:hypothetical protein
LDTGGKVSEQEPGAENTREGGRGEKRSSVGQIPRDAWVAEVVGDAANPQPVQLLTGYVGDAAEEGRTRIYFDPSLSSYVDVADEDVLRYEPLEGDHRPQGGAMIWLRAQQPAAAAGADFFTGPVMQQHLGAARGAEPVQITLLTVAGCITRQPPCPPLTKTFFPPCTFPVPIPRPTRFPAGCSWICQTPGGGFGHPGGGGGLDPEGTMNCPSFGCPTHLDCPRPWDPGRVVLPQQHAFMAGPAPVGPTGWQGCAPGADTTLRQTTTATVCTQIGCHTQAPHCPIGVTGWQGCTHAMGCPDTSTCPPQTHAFGCPRTSTCPPTAMVGCPDTSTCPPTHAFGCPDTSTCPPTHAFGCPDTSTCPPTDAFGCPRTSTCPPTHIPGCPNTSTCAPGAEMAAAGPAQTTATVCTQIGCHTSMLGCPQTSTCPPHGPIGVTGWLGCTQHWGCPSSSTCPPIPTLLTQCFICPPLPTMGPGCPPPGGGPHTIATICTQIGCPQPPTVATRCFICPPITARC